MSETPNQSPFHAAPEEEQLVAYKSSGKGRNWVEPTPSAGRFHSLRRLLAFGLMALFVSAPHVPINGKPAIFLDVLTRHFTFFGVTFQPTDNLLLMVFGVVFVISIFSVTALFGRIWCGYLCPQPVYLEFVYRPIEALFEGPASQRRKRHGAPLTAGILLPKLAKLFIYLLISLFLAHTFIAYFYGAERLLSVIGTNPAEHAGVFFAVMATTGLMLYDFTIYREHLCTYACPYGRLQSVLYDRDTMIVGYNAARGEPRGKPVKPGDEPAERGDCIDCRRCVETCPTGIDIRRGLQMECIGCAQCIDACNDVMTRLKRKPNLIGYTSLRELAGGKTRWLRGRMIGYAVLFTLAFGAFVTLLATRDVAEAHIARAAQEPYRLLPTGEVANQLRVRLTNRGDQPQSFTMELLSPKEGRLVSGAFPVVLQPGQVEHFNVAVVLPRSAFQRGRTAATFQVSSDGGFSKEREFLLIGPY